MSIIIGSDEYSWLQKIGIGICVVEISILIPEGYEPWTVTKIATLSISPKYDVRKNVLLYSTRTGTNIAGRMSIDTSGNVYLYTTETIPADGLHVQEQITYLAK